MEKLSSPVKRVLLRCVDMADSADNAKAMLMTMYQTGLLSLEEKQHEMTFRSLEAE